MSKLYYLVLVSLLSIEKNICLTITNQHPNTVSAILDSYPNSFTTDKTTDYHNIISPINRFINARGKDHGYLLNFTTSKPILSNNFKNINYSGELTSAASNIVEKNSYDYSDSSEEESEEQDPKGPPDHVIPYSEHENPKEPSTRPNYTAPGEWAKPPPDKNISLDFIPTKLYAQVRRTDTIKRVPREDAIRDAETDEEKENAARLKEVVKVSKANTIYTEEGYEDAAYDHAGQIRDADFEEGFTKKIEENTEKNNDKNLKKNKQQFPGIKSLDFGHFNDDYADRSIEIMEETQSLKKQLKPKKLNMLKLSINKPTINPKLIVEDGILQLDEDLVRESNEAMIATTNSYTTTPASTSEIFITESIIKNKLQHNITTVKPHTFTVRQQKPTKNIKKKPLLTKIKIPTKYYPSSKRSDNYDNFLDNQLYNGQTTVNQDQLWQSFFNKLNTTTSNQSVKDESQTSSPYIISSLPTLTINGHGPYHMAVTNTSNTFTPYLSKEQKIQPMTRYVTTPTISIVKSPFIHHYIENNPLPEADLRKEVRHQYNIPFYAHVIKKNDPLVNRYKKNSKNENNHEFKKPQSVVNNMKISEYPSDNKFNDLSYYTALRPPTMFDISNPHYMQEFIVQNNKKSVTNSNMAIEEGEPSQLELKTDKTTLPIVELLPPAPLSSSEYTSFLMRNRKYNPTPSSVMTIIPIIQAIQKYEKSQVSFPFFFRRKRAALDNSEELKNLNKRKVISKSILNNPKILNNEKILISNKKYPRNFERLLNESVNITDKEVDKEIQQRFNNTSKESKNQNESVELTDEVLDQIPKKDIHKEKVKEKNSVQVEVPELDFSSVFDEDISDEVDSTTTESSMDVKKYPFYKDKMVEDTALKYIINPKDTPHKTLGGMEFYNSRNLECEEINPNLENITPENEELENKQGPRKTKPRLGGLGNKLDCYKAKYFDENPLDNPLFSEKNIEVPSPPLELDPKKFASRLLELPSEKDEYVIPRGPKLLDVNLGRRKSYEKIPKNHNFQENNHFSYNQRFREPTYKLRKYKKSQRIPYMTMNHKNDMQSNKTLSKSKLKTSNSKITPAYQRHVYQDVMGTIKNLKNISNAQMPKKTLVSSYKNFHPLKNNKEKNDELKVVKKQKLIDMIGLIPPPRSTLYSEPYESRNVIYLNRMNHRHNLRRKPLHSRIFKRNVNFGDLKDVKLLNGNNDTIKNAEEKTTFSTISAPLNTTMIQENEKRYIKPSNIVHYQEGILTSDKYTKQPYQHSEELNKYDEFENDKKNLSFFTDSKKSDPRYNFKERKINRNLSDTLVSNSEKPDLSKVTTKFNVDSNTLDSTRVPIIIRPNEQSKDGISEESKTKYIKSTKAKNAVLNKRSNDFSGNDSASHKEPINNIRNKYLVNENIPGDSTEDNKNDTIVTGLSSNSNKNKITGLSEFLKGDPPGYDKAFKHQAYSKENEHQNNKSVDKSVSKKENKLKNNKSDEINESDATEETKELYSGENSSKMIKAKSQKINQSQNEEDNLNSSANESDEESFERYSDRPSSPPENYEDDHYSDLGPRVNKPHFYHPPFDIHKNEKYSLGKPVDFSQDNSDNSDGDDSDYDDYTSHSQETKKLKKYKSPWENDEDENTNESRHNSYYDPYKYPWERRKKKDRERRKREKFRTKYDSGHFYDESGDGDDDDSKEATNVKLIYVPLRKKPIANNKKINGTEMSVRRHPDTKFSSKYKSDIQLPLKVGDQKIISLSPEKNISNDVTQIPNELQYNTTNEITTVLSVTKSLSMYNTTNSPLLGLDNTVKYPMRMRGRKSTVNNNNIIFNSTQPVGENLHQISTTTISSSIKKRGRNRSNSSNSTNSTTISSVKWNGRMRNRLMTSTTSPNVVTTSKLFNNENKLTRSRRFDKRKNLPITNQNNSMILSSVSKPTEKTIKRHSRISKKQIITETFYSNEDDNDNREKKLSNDNTGSISIDKQPYHVKNLRRHTPKGKVEKITITMEETPSHVYKMKEIDKNGKKGKFVTITANNYSILPDDAPDDHSKNIEFDTSNSSRNILHFHDNCFENTITKPSKIQTTETPRGNGSHSSPSVNDKSIIDFENNIKTKQQITNNNSTEYNRSKNKSEDQRENDYISDENVKNEDDSSEDDGVEDYDSDEEDDSGENSDDADYIEHESDSLNKRETRKSNEKVEKNNEKRETPKNIIKDPNSRQYFYVE